MTAIYEEIKKIISTWYDCENNIHERIALEAMLIKSNLFKKFFENEICNMELISKSIKRVKRNFNHLY